MKFNLNDFLQLDVNGLLSVNGGTSCSSSSSSSSSESPSGPSNGPGASPTNPYKANYGGLSGGGGTCSSKSDSPKDSDPPKGGPYTPTQPTGGNGGGACSGTSTGGDKGNDDAGLAKVANGIAYPVGAEYSDKFIVTDVFGDRDPISTSEGETSKFHTGIDISAPEGTRINSVGDGYVSEVGYNAALGNYVVVTHPNGTHTRYAHCSEVSTGIGSLVSAGQQIATVGSTGKSTGSHLHLSYDGDGDGYYTNSAADNPNTLLSR